MFRNDTCAAKRHASWTGPPRSGRLPPHGTKFGRPRKVDVADAAKAQKLREKGIAATDITRMLGVSRATVYRYLADEPLSA